MLSQLKKGNAHVLDDAGPPNIHTYLFVMKRGLARWIFDPQCMREIIHSHPIYLRSKGLPTYAAAVLFEEISDTHNSKDLR